MKIVPASGPQAVEATTNSAPSPDARARAIAKIQQGTSAQVAETPADVALAQAAANVSQPIEITQESVSTEGKDSTNEAQEPSKPAATEDKALSPQYAAIARKERALRDQVRQFKAEQQAFKAEQESAKARLSQEQQGLISKDKLLKDPWSVLSENGITYDQLTSQALNPPSQQDQMIAKLEAKIAALEDGYKQTNTNIEQRETQAYAQAVEQIRNDVKKMVFTDPNFETIKETRSINDVVQLIEKTFKEDGVLLSVEEAAQAVEDHLVEEAMKITKIKKIQQRLTQSALPTKPKAESKPNEQQSNQLKTLTNSVGSTRPLSSKERAIAVMEGRLAPSFRKQ